MLNCISGAWIISGGTNTGVMKIVGEAVNDYQMTSASSDQKIVALGIATWGIINNKKDLVNPDGRVSMNFITMVQLTFQKNMQCYIISSLFYFIFFCEIF